MTKNVATTTTCTYKGYIGEFSCENGSCFGTVAGIDSVVTFRGKTPTAAYIEFRNTVDDHIAFLSKNK